MHEQQGGGATPVPERDGPERPALQGTYIPPPKRDGWRKNAGPAAVGLGLLAAKFKAVLYLLLSFKWFALGLKFFGSSLSLIVSVWFYALFWGWPFAAVFVALIFVHEMGHALVMRIYGVPGSLPYFIPGLGALINMQGPPASVLHESYIALAGPVFGSLGALACYLYGLGTLNAFWIACAYTGFFLNLFNLFPVLPLDGGRVVGSISPRIWIFGLVAIIVAALSFHWWNPLLLILIIPAIPRAIAAWRGMPVNAAAYYQLTLLQRTGVAVAYFGLCGLLFIGMQAARIPVPGSSGG
ncbi:MAG TPA: site-2 protease family protein [Candidatus Acidoferrales bacterium]|nr:site-2 protease family protein [Candidatus Acidoferrales bacterium]